MGLRMMTAFALLRCGELIFRLPVNTCGSLKNGLRTDVNVYGKV